MFSKILIANRGEIAVRVIRTARRMGIKTVVVHSEADATSLAVELADEAVAIGPAPAAESYLRADRILAAVRETGAEAVHPGFGFLSENAAFARDLEKAGIVFIGPGPEAIAAMGDKIESKRLAEEAGVSTVPGYPGAIADIDEARKIADDVGYPVMIKASAGGGGKGMRIAWTEAELADGFRSATNEARNSFGDERVFIERFVESPRHIEIQVLADAHGNTIHLGERECSIQRRHQKVIEEAPSPFLDAETRKAMGAQAVALARAVGYRSAGTVEFIVDPERRFYFLEMNTRLQVEHPVTEAITGLDLVEEMLRIAAGEKLRHRQEDIKFDGWALEARLYAEDPARGFVPSIGRIARYDPPAETDGVRIDSGIVEGSEISMYYDPMIAKLVIHGPSREVAVDRMAMALDRYYVRGISHNVPFLRAVVANPRFREGRLSTAFIDEEFPDGFDPSSLGAAETRIVVAVAAIVHRRKVGCEATISGQLPGRTRSVANDWVVLIDREAYPVEIRPEGEDFRLRLGDGNGDVRVVGDWVPGQPVFVGSVDGVDVAVQIDPDGPGYAMTYGGGSVRVLVLSPRAAELAALMPVKEPPDTSNLLLSPMPGLLVQVAVEAGWEVKAGQELAVVEAMKMENILRADRDGVVKEVVATPGDSLAADQIILEFE